MRDLSATGVWRPGPPQAVERPRLPPVSTYFSRWCKYHVIRCKPVFLTPMNDGSSGIASLMRSPQVVWRAPDRASKATHSMSSAQPQGDSLPWGRLENPTIGSMMLTARSTPLPPAIGVAAEATRCRRAAASPARRRDNISVHRKSSDSIILEFRHG